MKLLYKWLHRLSVTDRIVTFRNVTMCNNVAHCNAIDYHDRRRWENKTKCKCRDIPAKPFSRSIILINMALILLSLGIVLHRT